MSITGDKLPLKPYVSFSPRLSFYDYLPVRPSCSYSSHCIVPALSFRTVLTDQYSLMPMVATPTSILSTLWCAYCFPYKVNITCTCCDTKVTLFLLIANYI